jgi:DNA-binding transcriptional ArsR family regulator
VTTLAPRDHSGLLGLRFAWSPAWETMAAVRTFVDERAHPPHRLWRAAVADRAVTVDLVPLLALLPRRGFVPDFVTPPPAGPTPRLRDQLAAIRATPVDQVKEELRRCLSTTRSRQARAALEGFLRDPAAARTLLADRLHAAWRELVAPFWPRIRALLDADIAHRSRLAARHGLRRALVELDPRIGWQDERLVVDDGSSRRVDLDERGLVLMPTAFSWPYVIAIVDPPWQPTLVYPVRGIEELWHAPPTPPAALARLLGRTRALVLASLDRPLSTTALAALADLSPSGVSRHMLALRDAGLVSATRHGHEVRYARTRLGSALLRGTAAE